MLWEEEELVFDDCPSLNTLYNQLPNAKTLLEYLHAHKLYLLDKELPKKAKLIQKYIEILLQILDKKMDITTQRILQVPVDSLELGHVSERKHRKFPIGKNS
jgi:hypothetical protein